MRPAFMTLEAAFAYYTECNLATLEKLQSSKRTPKSELRRQGEITRGMLRECQTFKNKDPYYTFANCPRLKQILEIQ